MKCSACGDRAIGPGPNGTRACRDCLRLLKIKKVKWLEVARVKDPWAEGANPDHWDSSRSGREIFEAAVEEAKRLKLGF